MSDCVESRHTEQVVGGGAGHGQPQIDCEQGLCGLGNTRGELGVLGGAGSFRLVKLHAPDTQHGQDRHRHHDDADTAQPLQQLPVEEDGFGQLVQPDDNRGAGGGQAGDGFEDRIRRAQVQRLAQGEGQCAVQPQHGPEQRGDQEAVADTQIVGHVAYRQPHQQAGKEGYPHGRQEAPHGAVVRQERQDQRQQRGTAEQHQQDAENPEGD